jgi:hypothetical protein
MTPTLPPIFDNVDTSDWDEMSPEDLMFDQSKVRAYPSCLAGARALKYSRGGKSALYDDIGFRVYVTIPRRGTTALRTIPRMHMERTIADRTQKSALVQKVRRQSKSLQHRYLTLPRDGTFSFEVTPNGLVEFKQGKQESVLMSLTDAPEMLAPFAEDWDETKIVAQHLHQLEMQGTIWLPLTVLIRTGRFMMMQDFRSDLVRSISPGCFYLFLSHRWLSSEQPDPDSLQARFAAWQIVVHLCEAIYVANLRGLNVTRKKMVRFGQAAFGIAGSELAEALIVNVLRPALNNESLAHTLKEVESLDEFIDDYGVSGARDDMGLRKLNAIVESRPNFKALLEKIYVWYDYSCLPQKPRSPEDETLFQKGLAELLLTQLLGRTAILLDKVDDYFSRAWCLYECITADSVSNMDLLVASSLTSSSWSTGGEFAFWDLFQFRPHIVWRAILDTEIFAVQAADVCMTRLGLSSADPNDTLIIYRKLKELPAPRKVSIDPGELITGIFPLPVVSGAKKVLMSREFHKNLKDTRAVKKLTLDWTKVMQIETGWSSGQCDAAILPFLTFDRNVGLEQSWSPAHIAVVGGSEGEAVLFTNWVVRHRDDLERALEVRTTSISWLSSDIAPVGHCVLGTLRAVAVDALVWIIVSLKSRIQQCSVTNGLIETVAAANLQYVTIAVDVNINNVACVPVLDKTRKIPPDGFDVIDIEANGSVEHVGGLFSSSVINNLLKPAHSPTQQNRVSVIPVDYDILEGERLRDQLFTAFYHDRRDEFAHTCQSRRSTVLSGFSLWTRIPEAMRNDAPKIQQYAKMLLVIAEVFERAGYPELMASLTGGRDNPIINWQDRLASAAEMSDIGDYEKSTTILKAIMHDMEGCSGSGIDDLLPKVLGRLGSNAFYMDDMATALAYTKRALEACGRTEDHEGVRIYRDNLQIFETVGILSSGNESAVYLSSVIDSIENAQRLSDKGRYMKSNVTLQKLLMSLSKNKTQSGNAYRGKIYGLMGSNYFKLGDGKQAQKLMNMALKECKRVEDGYGSKVYAFNLEKISQPGYLGKAKKWSIKKYQSLFS